MTTELSPTSTSLVTPSTSMPHATALHKTNPPTLISTSPVSTPLCPVLMPQFPCNSLLAPECPNYSFLPTSLAPYPLQCLTLLPMQITLDPPPPEDPLPLDGPQGLPQATQANYLAEDHPMADPLEDGAWPWTTSPPSMEMETTIITTTMPDPCPKLKAHRTIFVTHWPRKEAYETSWNYNALQFALHHTLPQQIKDILHLGPKQTTYNGYKALVTQVDQRYWEDHSKNTAPRTPWNTSSNTNWQARATNGIQPLILTMWMINGEDYRGPDPNIFSTPATLLRTTILAPDNLPAHLPSHFSTNLLLHTTLPFANHPIPTLVNSGATDNFIDESLAALAPHPL
ncbi:hypothetical protein E4T56_gene7069 [Termitomyces sp. T112]|nr:hypothetical protein E4T56_gene7069 [Termitomyces sp. T112]